ncbi:MULTISPECIES: DUF2975 domain-containing protein [Paenibacillus]|uniref:DUF2975 domain-containing protein n=1 Tax=Paenibacillus campinasensis TaxID=66347 RepID=A0ABW9T589_9BACL|nr:MULTISPECIES: DUF2975 domain-containing protein [Paenibacillus]MUG66811.1 DUF2975 domain-containing protein [Paenibacillus campinasensis]PAK55828.1 hypothetical protein CHH75_00730 [Paenibacillus sp. 7541]
MKRETLFLKLTVFLIGTPIALLCVWGLPSIMKDAAAYFPAYWLYPVLAGMYISAIPFFVALVQAYKLLNYIDRNEAFSDLSVRALRTIKYCGLSISGLYAVILPFLFFMADMDDAPGLLAIGIIIVFASFVIAAFAALLQKLLQNAIDIKSENDLTV